MQKGFCPAGNHQTKTEQIQRKKWNEEMWKKWENITAIVKYVSFLSHTVADIRKNNWRMKWKKNLDVCVLSCKL